MRKILVTSKIYDDSFSALSGDFELIIPEEGNFSNDELIEKIVDCEVLISMFTVKIGSDVLEAGKKLKMVSNYGAGFNNVDMQYADAHGIVVTNTPDPVTEPTAELAFGFMNALARRMIEFDRDIRVEGKIKWGLMTNISSTLIGKTLGIIGFGRIGQALARRAKAAGMNVVYYSRHQVNADIEQMYDAKYVSVNDLLAMSDFVSLNTPLTNETRHLIGEKQLAMMKPTAYIINTARGPVIDEHALALSLKNNVIAGAGIDVFENEPAIDPLLLTCENAILVPHVGTATKEARQDTAKMACDNILGFYAGKKDIHRCGKW